METRRVRSIADAKLHQAFVARVRGYARRHAADPCRVGIVEVVRPDSERRLFVAQVFLPPDFRYRGEDHEQEELRHALEDVIADDVNRDLAQSTLCAGWRCGEVTVHIATRAQAATWVLATVRETP